MITCNRETEWKSQNAAAICLMCKSASLGSLSVNQLSTRSKSDIRAIREAAIAAASHRA
jgi:hypothetical protein